MMGYFEAFKYYAYEESVIVQKKAFTALSERAKLTFYIKYDLNNVKKRTIGNVLTIISSQLDFGIIVFLMFFVFF